MKLFEIKNRWSGDVLFSGKFVSLKLCIKAAVKVKANLREANLREADLRGADLRGADLREADLREADLWGADLREADLRGANLREANLREADLDFSCWGFSCKTFNVKVSDKLVCQLLHHVAKLDVSGCSPVVNYAHRVIFATWPGKWLANKFCEHRNDIEPI